MTELERFDGLYNLGIFKFEDVEILRLHLKGGLIDYYNFVPKDQETGLKYFVSVWTETGRVRFYSILMGYVPLETFLEECSPEIRAIIFYNLDLFE
jgi:hypothetical protein